MNAFATFGPIAGVIAFPVVFGGCCGGGLVVPGSGTLAALGSWLGGSGFVARVIVARAAASLVRAIIRPRPKCEPENEMET